MDRIEKAFEMSDELFKRLIGTTKTSILRNAGHPAIGLHEVPPNGRETTQTLRNSPSTINFSSRCMQYYREYRIMENIIPSNVIKLTFQSRIRGRRQEKKHILPTFAFCRFELCRLKIGVFCPLGHSYQ
jgi:hypothetical protein